MIIINECDGKLDCSFYTVVDSMKSVLKKTKGSDMLKEKEEPAVESNPLARGKKDVKFCG